LPERLSGSSQADDPLDGPGGRGPSPSLSPSPLAEYQVVADRTSAHRCRRSCPDGDSSWHAIVVGLVAVAITRICLLTPHEPPLLLPGKRGSRILSVVISTRGAAPACRNSNILWHRWSLVASGGPTDHLFRGNLNSDQQCTLILGLGLAG